MARPIEIFFSYAHEDGAFMDAVREHLINFQYEGKIEKWHDRMIPPGTEWRGEVDYRLRRSRIILLLVSVNFLKSRYIFHVEMKEALARHASGESRVIPIILAPCLWKRTALAELQVLPAEGKPITQWGDGVSAYADVAEGIMQVVDELSGEGE